MNWQQSESGLYLPVPKPDDSPVQSEPQAEPDEKFRVPLPGELRGVMGVGFETYIVKMTGRPCPWCKAPIEQGERHETACGFACSALCGWRACARACGRVTVANRDGSNTTLELR